SQLSHSGARVSTFLGRHRSHWEPGGRRARVFGARCGLSRPYLHFRKWARSGGEPERRLHSLLVLGASCQRAPSTDVPAPPPTCVRSAKLLACRPRPTSRTSFGARTASTWTRMVIRTRGFRRATSSSSYGKTAARLGPAY